MIEIKNKAKCSGCYSCINICPKNCIEMKTDNEGFWYPYVDREKCIGCELCKKRCPILNDMSIQNEPHAYACFNKDKKIRKESSSGGIFTLLASYVIDNGGIVYGAAFNEAFEVEHIEVTNKQDLSKLRGSKYVQSNLGNTYSKIKEHLNQNRLVYFSGTPCQIDGLLCFLNRKYDNLICQDLICHGVPSPNVWKKYLKEKNKDFKNIPKKINFRNKEYGWESFDMCIEYDNFTYNKIYHKDSFMQMFLKDLCLRPSCYDCHSKSLHRNSDITLADFWGIKEVCPEMYDNKGTSLVFVNSNKGKKLFDKISKDIKYQKVDINKAVKYNIAAYKSADIPKKRNAFMKEIFDNSFDKITQKYTKTNKVVKLFNYIKIIIKNMVR